nr:helix-turn-helix domain-containing protein [Reyranella soli]
MKKEREDRNWSQAELARRVSNILRRKVTQVAIHHIEKRDDVMPRFVVELAQALDVRLPWLQYGRGSKSIDTSSAASEDPRYAAESKSRSRQSEVRHYVGAGDEIHRVNGETEWTPSPPGFESNTGAAVVVRGGAMRPFYDTGDVLFFTSQRNPPLNKKDMPPRPVIVQVKDGSLYVKRLIPGTKKGFFHLISINPVTPILEDQPVESFAYIEWVKQRVI